MSPKSREELIIELREAADMNRTLGEKLEELAVDLELEENPFAELESMTRE